MVMPNRHMLLDWHMLAIELIYVMDGLCDADSDDGWVTWVGVWEELVILLRSAILVATIEGGDVEMMYEFKIW